MASKNENIMMRILTRRVRPVLRVILEESFLSAKQELLKAVESHPISQDIMSHSPSPLLGSSTGTLFGFLGFDSGDNPIEDLINFLDQVIMYKPLGPTKNKLFSSRVTIPTKDTFDNKVFHLDWIDRGWPVMIEEGVSGLPYYINKFSNNSRSEEGYQSKNQVRSKDWSGQSYLSPLLADFRKNLLIGRRP